MNITQAKQVPMETLLERLGHKPVHEKRGELWYLSPFREEVDASFSVNRDRSIWYDFGDGIGGDCIKLVQQLYRLPNVSSSLEKLAELMGDTPPNPPQRQAKDAKPTATESKITHIGPIVSKALVAYLKRRGIDPEIAATFVQEVHYQRGGKDYYSLGFENNSHGYELRNKHFKGCIGTKDITEIGGHSDRVAVFEGFSDFLSALSIGDDRPSATVIVLNGTAQKNLAINRINELKPKVVELYRDNDQGGLRLLADLQAALPETSILDQAHRYTGFKDLNQWYVDEYLPSHRYTPVATHLSEVSRMAIGKNSKEPSGPSR